MPEAPVTPQARPKSGHILGLRVDATSYESASSQILDWAENGETRYVCVANVHMVMEAYDDPCFREIVNSADLVTPDGMPLVWMLRGLGFPRQERVYGPTLTLAVVRKAADRGVPVGFFGGTPEAVAEMTRRFQKRLPTLKVVYRYSPPFRPLSEIEQESVETAIRKSGARVLFVGLGCPKQERWMGTHYRKLGTVMIGVGAAFDFHSGRVPQAPPWLQALGLEWCFRLAVEPRRLWRRYLSHNPRFVWLALQQLRKDRRA